MIRYGTGWTGKLYVGLKYLVQLFVILFLIFPIYWIVAASLRENEELLKTKWSFFPKNVTLAHYVEAIQSYGLFHSFLNSLYITSITVLISVAVAFFMAYAISRYKVRGVHFIHVVLITTQFIPVIVYLIPLYLFMSRLHLLNTHYALVITYLSIGIPISTILLKTYLEDLPVEIEEAAKIDGCNIFQLLRKIVIPLAIPGTLSTAIIIFIIIWQEFLVAVSFISKPEAYTVSIGLTQFRGQYGTDWGGLMAASIIVSVPALFLFVTTRKWFVNSLVGSVKG